MQIFRSRPMKSKAGYMWVKKSRTVTTFKEKPKHYLMYTKYIIGD